jgi:restriction endonuclease Mrr
MAIPTKEKILVPLLKYLGDGELHTITSSTLQMAKFFKLTKEEKWRIFKIRKPKKTEPTLTATHIYIRTAEAVGILNKKELIRYAPGMKKRGVFQISGGGLNIIRNTGIDSNKLSDTRTKFAKNEILNYKK